MNLTFHSTKHPITEDMEVSLRGDFSKLNFATLWNWLYREKITGYFAAVIEEKEYSISFKQGYPVSIRGNFAEHFLGEILVSEGSLSTEDFNLFLEKKKSSPQPLGAILLQHQKISADSLQRALYKQISARLPFFFQQSKGSYRFHTVGEVEQDISPYLVNPFVHFSRCWRAIFETKVLEAHLQHFQTLAFQLKDDDASSKILRRISLPSKFVSVLPLLENLTTAQSFVEQGFLPEVECLQLLCILDCLKLFLIFDIKKIPHGSSSIPKIPLLMEQTSLPTSTSFFEEAQELKREFQLDRALSPEERHFLQRLQDKLRAVEKDNHREILGIHHDDPLQEFQLRDAYLHELLFFHPDKARGTELDYFCLTLESLQASLGESYSSLLAEIELSEPVYHSYDFLLPLPIPKR